jgi:flagellar hook-associated protein 3 FlgL
MRVTSQMMHESRMQTVQNKASQLLEAQEKMASGKNFSKPSDAPAEMRKSRAVELTIAEESRYLALSDDAISSLNATQTALTQISSHLSDARETAIAGGNGMLLPEDRKVLATQLDHALESLAELANSRHAGQSLFAGTNTTEASFGFTRDSDNRITAANYQGNSETHKIPIGQSEAISATVPGDEAFSDGFAALVKLRDLLLNKDNLPENQQLAAISDMLTDLGKTSERVLSHLATVGSSLEHVESQASRHEDERLNLSQELSKYQDLDIPTAVTELNVRSNAYTASLYAVAQGSQKSLLDFMT